MFDTINGLPIHPLVVHAVVVLLPLSILGTLALVIRPSWRERYGILLVLVTAAGTALIPVATSSGEALERHVGSPGDHAQLGDQLIWFALALLVFITLFVWLDRRHRAWMSGVDKPEAGDARTESSTAVTVVAAPAVVAAVATGVQVHRVGDSGARAAWGSRISSHASH